MAQHAQHGMRFGIRPPRGYRGGDDRPSIKVTAEEYFYPKPRGRAVRQSEPTRVKVVKPQPMAVRIAGADRSFVSALGRAIARSRRR